MRETLKPTRIFWYSVKKFGKKWIKWKKDKTNRDYIRELSTTDWHSNFRSVTIMFEKVWYGKKELGGMDFRSSVQPQLQNMLKETQQAKKKN